MVSRLETGEQADARFITMAKIAKVLGLSLDALAQRIPRAEEIKDNIEARVAALEAAVFKR